MEKKLFSNDSLVSLLVPFVGKVESRIAALLAREVVTSKTLTRNETAFEFSDELVNGVCADIVQEIQQTRNAAVVAQPGLSVETISEFIYLLAALVDEMLIAMSNTQLPQHFNGEVEHMVFGTRDAGEQVFMRIERLLARRSQLDFSLAGAYLLVLSLGFKGQYFQQGKSEVLTQYHRDLSSVALRSGADSLPRKVPVDATDGASVTSGVATHHQLSLLWFAIGLTWLAAVVGMEIFWRIETAPVRRTVVELHAPVSPTTFLGNDR